MIDFQGAELQRYCVEHSLHHIDGKAMYHLQGISLPHFAAQKLCQIDGFCTLIAYPGAGTIPRCTDSGSSSWKLRPRALRRRMSPCEIPAQKLRENMLKMMEPVPKTTDYTGFLLHVKHDKCQYVHVPRLIAQAEQEAPN